MGKTRKPSKYETHVEPYLEDIRKWKQSGLIDEAIAKKLRVAYSTFKTYKANNNPYCIKHKIDTSALADVLKIGNEELVINIEDSLFTKAVYGSTKTKTTYKMLHGKKVIDTIVEEHLPPDNTCIIFSLKRLRPDIYGDKVEYIDLSAYDSSVGLVKDIMNRVKDIENKK